MPSIINTRETAVCQEKVGLILDGAQEFRDGNLMVARRIDWWQNARIMMIRKRLPVLLFLVCTAAPFRTSSAAAQETLRYAIVSNGKTQGSEVDVFGSDG